MKTSILKEFGLENFRVFREKTSFELAPITLLTGANSSGKSSVIKALKLMQNFHKSNCYEKDSENRNLDFGENENYSYRHQLGNFELVVNDDNNDKKEFSVFYKIPMNADVLLQHPKLQREKGKKFLDAIKLFAGFEGELYIENTFSIIEAKPRLGNLEKSAIFAEYGEEKIKLIEWHKDLWNSSAFDTEVGKSVDFEDSKWDFYVNFPMLIKYISTLAETNKELFTNLIEKKISIDKIPPYLRDFAILFAKSLNDKLIETVLQLSVDQLNNFEWEIWSILNKKYPENQDINSIESLKKLVEKMEFELVKDNEFIHFDSTSLLKYPAGLISEYNDILPNNTLGLIADYLKDPFQRLTNFDKNADYLYRNESYVQWLSIVDYLSLLEYICSRQGSISEYYKENVELINKRIENYQYQAPENTFDLLIQFSDGLNSIFDTALQLFNTNCEFIEVTKANTQRLYSESPQGTSFNKYLADYSDKDHSDEINLFFDKWVNEFEIGDSVKINRGSGYTILEVTKDNKTRNIVDVGFGVTQIVALILRIVTAAETGKTTVLIEEPEINLHPKLQSKLADLFIDANKTFELNFIVETHSEYLIRRTQVITARQNYIDQEDVDKNNIFKVYYFPINGVPYEMRSSKNGRFIEKFGEGFFDAAAFDSLNLSKIERERR
jgi:predicted ATPase